MYTSPHNLNLAISAELTALHHSPNHSIPPRLCRWLNTFTVPPHPSSTRPSPLLKFPSTSSSSLVSPFHLPLMPPPTLPSSPCHLPSFHPLSSLQTIIPPAPHIIPSLSSSFSLPTSS